MVRRIYSPEEKEERFENLHAYLDRNPSKSERLENYLTANPQANTSELKNEGFSSLLRVASSLEILREYVGVKAPRERERDALRLSPLNGRKEKYLEAIARKYDLSGFDLGELQELKRAYHTNLPTLLNLLDKDGLTIEEIGTLLSVREQIRSFDADIDKLQQAQVKRSLDKKVPLSIEEEQLVLDKSVNNVTLQEVLRFSRIFNSGGELDSDLLTDQICRTYNIITDLLNVTGTHIKGSHVQYALHTVIKESKRLDNTDLNFILDNLEDNVTKRQRNLWLRDHPDDGTRVIASVDSINSPERYARTSSREIEDEEETPEIKD